MPKVSSISRRTFLKNFVRFYIKNKFGQDVNNVVDSCMYHPESGHCLYVACPKIGTCHVIISEENRIKDYRKVHEWGSSSTITNNFTIPATHFALAHLAKEARPLATPFLFALVAPSGHVLSFYQLPNHLLLPSESYTQSTDWSFAVTDLVFLAIYFYKNWTVETVVNVFKILEFVLYMDDEDHVRVCVSGMLNKQMSLRIVQQYSQLSEELLSNACDRSRSEVLNFAMLTSMQTILLPLFRWWVKSRIPTRVICPVLSPSDEINVLIDRNENPLFRQHSEPLKNIKLTCAVNRNHLLNTQWHHFVFCVSPITSLYDFLFKHDYRAVVEPDYLSPTIEWLSH